MCIPTQFSDDGRFWASLEEDSELLDIESHVADCVELLKSRNEVSNGWGGGTLCTSNRCTVHWICWMILTTHHQKTVLEYTQRNKRVDIFTKYRQLMLGLVGNSLVAKLAKLITTYLIPTQGA